MSDDLDDVTHSDDPSCCSGAHYEPTTKDQRERRLAWLKRMGFSRPFELRLIADVERLEAELEGRIIEDSVLCPHAPQHVLEEKCKELEAERGCPSCAHCILKRGGHLG